MNKRGQDWTIFKKNLRKLRILDFGGKVLGDFVVAKSTMESLKFRISAAAAIFSLQPPTWQFHLFFCILHRRFVLE